MGMFNHKASCCFFYLCCFGSSNTKCLNGTILTHIAGCNRSPLAPKASSSTLPRVEYIHQFSAMRTYFFHRKLRRAKNFKNLPPTTRNHSVSRENIIDVAGLSTKKPRCRNLSNSGISKFTGSIFVVVPPFLRWVRNDEFVA